MIIHAIEDEAALLNAIVMFLNKAGHKVTKSTNGTEAISKIKKINPELIIVDLLLPGIQGLDIIKTVRAEGYAGRIIIFTNSDPTVIDEKFLDKHKVDKVLVKSNIHLTELGDIITSFNKK